MTPQSCARCSQPELVLQGVKLWPFQRVPGLAQPLQHGHFGSQKGAGKAVAGPFDVQLGSQSFIQYQVGQLMGEGEALPVAGPAP